MLRLFALAGLAMTVLGARRRSAQAQNATLYTVTYVEVGPVLAKIGAGALHAYRDAARKDAVSLDVFQRIDRPNQFVVLGAWADQKAFETPSGGDAAKKLNEKLATMLAAPTDTRQHNALSVAPAKTGKDPIVRRHPRRCHPAREGQRRQRARAARRRQPQARRQSAIRRLAADQPAQPFHRGRSLGQPRRLRRPRDAEGNPRIPHEARADVGRALRRAALQGAAVAQRLCGRRTAPFEDTKGAGRGARV